MSLKLFFFISCFYFPVYGMSRISFLDVGQGNCTVVANDKSVMLVDCGSKSYSFKNDPLNKELTYEKIQMRGIIRVITDLLGHRNTKKRLTVVISHPDSDHYGWVLKVLEDKDIKDRISAIILGGAEAFYEAKFMKKLKGLGVPLTWPAVDPNTLGTMSRMQPFSLDDIKWIELANIEAAQSGCFLLPALGCTKKDESNDSSLVVLIKNGLYNSVMLTGDATKKTTDHIIKCFSTKPELLKVSILQASHHGAADEGCNDASWIAATAPKCIVLSTGIHGDYFHPNAEVVDRFAECVSLKDGKAYRVLYVGLRRNSPDRLVRVHAAIKKDQAHYGVMMTSKMIYSTLNHGNITFTWSGNDAPPKIPPPPMLTKTNVVNGTLEAYGHVLDFNDVSNCIFSSLIEPSPVFEGLAKLFANKASSLH